MSVSLGFASLVAVVVAVVDVGDTVVEVCATAVPVARAPTVEAATMMFNRYCFFIFLPLFVLR